MHLYLTKHKFTNIILLFNLIWISFLFAQYHPIRVLADTPSENLISTSDDFSGNRWVLDFNNNSSNTGLSSVVTKDSDGDTAVHITGVANATGIYGIWNNQNQFNHPLNTVFSAYVKGTFDTGSIYEILTEQEDVLSTNVNTDKMQIDRYTRFWSAQQVNSKTNSMVNNSEVVYFNAVAGSNINIWIKHLKLETGSTMGFDQTTIASGTDGTSPWTLDNNGVLSFGAGTLDRDTTQDILEEYKDNITSITTANADGKVVLPADSSYIFKNPNVTRDDINNAQDTSIAASPSNNLKSIDFSNIDTSNVTNMHGFLIGNDKLTSITGLNKFDTSKVTNMAYAFSFLDSLPSIDFSSFNTSKVTTFTSFIHYDKALTSIDVSNFDVSNAQSLSEFFATIPKLTSIDISNWNTKSNLTTTWMFANDTNLSSIKFGSGWNTSKVTTTNAMFINTPALSTIDNLSSWDTSNVIDMSNMFSSSGLISFDANTWNTSKLTSTHNMFLNASKLASVNMSKWDVSNVTDMGNMFNGTTSLTALDISDWNTKNVTQFGTMFADSGLKSLDISDWNISSATDVSHLFHGDANLTSLDLSNWNGPNIVYSNHMFYGDINLTNLDLSNWTTAKTTNMGDMFTGVSKLKYLTVGNETKFDSSTNLLSSSWFNASTNGYYATTNDLISHLHNDVSIAGQYQIYTPSTMTESKTKSQAVTVSANTDLSKVQIPLNDLLYTSNDALNANVSVKTTDLSDGTHAKSYTIKNIFAGAPVITSNTADSVVKSLTQTASNYNQATLSHDSSMTFDLSSMKYGYAGTYTTNITYTISDKH